MYLKLTDYELEVINQFEKEMMIDMGVNNNMLPLDGIVTVLEDTLTKINRLNDEITVLTMQIYEKGEEPLC